MERMKRPPYINYSQAKVIIEYRKKKGILKSLKQLSLDEEFTPIDLERIEPYIVIINKKKMHSYHTRQECITHKQNKHSTIIFTDFRREATINI